MRFELWSLPAMLMVLLAASRAPAAVSAVDSVAITVSDVDRAVDFYSRVLSFEKVADRQTWDFPLVNVAAAMQVQNGVIKDARIVCGGVSAVPHRLNAVEEIVKGKPMDEANAKLAGQSATRGARPLNYNGFKIPLMANLVTRAVRDAKA